MDKIHGILMVGVGGQGVVLASDILALAAMHAGFDVKKSEIHGMSQRGGSIFSFIRFGKKVYSPIISEGQTDILLSMEEMETLRWMDYLNPETRLIVSKMHILPANVTEYPEGVEKELRAKFRHLKFVDTDQLVKQLGNPKVVNVAFLGMMAEALPMGMDHWASAIKEAVPQKTYEKNMEAFELGRTKAKEV
jgi:indolepyruvate ferredoxin oxidoreductase beta subunit